MFNFWFPIIFFFDSDNIWDTFCWIEKKHKHYWLMKDQKICHWCSRWANNFLNSHPCLSTLETIELVCFLLLMLRTVLECGCVGNVWKFSVTTIHVTWWLQYNCANCVYFQTRTDFNELGNFAEFPPQKFLFLSHFLSHLCLIPWFY